MRAGMLLLFMGMLVLDCGGDEGDADGDADSDTDSDTDTDTQTGADADTDADTDGDTDPPDPCTEVGLTTSCTGDSACGKNDRCCAFGALQCCTWIAEDSANCGACGFQCDATEDCDAGLCMKDTD